MSVKNPAAKVMTGHKKITVNAEPQKLRSQPSTPQLIFSAIGAVMLTNVRIGGTFSPFLVSLVTALSPLNAAAALVSGFISTMLTKSLWECAAELCGALIMLIYGIIFAKKKNPYLKAIISGLIYFICASAIAAGTSADWVLFAAVLVRGVMCGAVTFCMITTANIVTNGINESIGSSNIKIVSLCTVFMLIISALCSHHIWVLNIGRICAGFCAAAAARKFGVRGGAVIGILSAAAFLLADDSLGRSGAMLAFSAVAAGIYQPKGKYAVDISFICAAFGITCAAGMPTGTPLFIADMGLAAALYCLIPERLYLTRLNGICIAKNPKSIGTDKLKFASKIIEEVGGDANTASQLLSKRLESITEDKDTVQSRVCGTFCSQLKCSAACSSFSSDIRDGCFRAAQTLAENKGSITPSELPTGFDGCSKKAKLAEGFNYAVGIKRAKASKNAFMRRFLEGTSEQLHASCEMISTLSARLDINLREDFSLSEAAEKILSDADFDVKSVSVSFDDELNPFIEAYIYTDSGYSEVFLSDVSDNFANLLGCELAKPVMITCSDDEKKLSRVRFRAQSKYIPECHISAAAAESSVCGDSHITFEDGLGNFFVIIADGMGKGGRAAAQSSLAVNLLKRLILSGISIASAVRTLNVLMLASTPDETFTTVDIFTVNLFTGNARIIKMGAAPTIISSREDTTQSARMITDCAAPVGIIGTVDIKSEVFSMDESSRAVMMTDGISIEAYTYITALLENEKLTCQQISDRIMAATDEKERESEQSFIHRDDKTTAVIRLYRS